MLIFCLKEGFLAKPVLNKDKIDDKFVSLRFSAAERLQQPQKQLKGSLGRL
tara:strand:+ start:404 stop:556 length:153 start_codon:yes stop_codon:yes gene_type:complete